ncbi:MAG: cell division protein FtsL [Clostridiales Family XIII bacterium]|jgi:cell division protein FtsL|nr:cell division protein FtsL [Clostridiales Family XIII bacterium]
MALAEKSYPKSYPRSYRQAENDIRYGINMRPSLLKPVKTEKTAPKPEKAGITHTPGVKRLLMGALTVAILVGAGMIITTTYASAIKFNINLTRGMTTELMGEIENLEVRIKTGNGVDVIERRATEELGMLYPAPEQFVFLEEEPETVADFAQYIKENAYQLW